MCLTIKTHQTDYLCERILLIFRVMEAPASNPGPKTGYFMFFVILFRPLGML
jgi:hypothetical protein